MYIANKLAFTDTIGLVACGGRSSRMGTDKSMLQYYGQPQRYYVYKMLQPLCAKVFLSCNEAQAQTIDEGYSFLTDNPANSDIGPMTALMTAYENFPQMNILLIGCDYPFLATTDLIDFSFHCVDKPASFYNAEENIYEPLLAWYPHQLYNRLQQMQAAKQFSLQHFLKDNQAIKFFPTNRGSIVSVDTNEAFVQTYDKIV